MLHSRKTVLLTQVSFISAPCVLSLTSAVGVTGQILGKVVVLNTTSSTVSISRREQETF